MGWSFGFGGTLALAGGSVLLGSCGGSGGSDEAASGDTPAAPAVDIPVIDQPSRVSMSVQARQVQWVPGRNPSRANAWVYAADGVTAAGGVLSNHLGPTIEVRRGTPCTVTWSNTIPASGAGSLVLAEPPINAPPVPSLCGAVVQQSPVGVVTHLHGARVEGGSDGWPLTPLGFASNPYGFPTAREFTYPNAQRAAMLWYHDHAMDRAGINVHAGLAGLYFVRDAADDALLALLGGKAMELPLVVQDRVVTADETGVDLGAGIRAGADEAAGSRPEFLGTTLFVNGHPAGEFAFQRRVWRLRVLNGSNTRTLALALVDIDGLEGAARRIWYTQLLRVVGSDGGLLGRSVELTPTDVLVVTPAQRRDLLLDLSALPSSVRRLRLVNVALAPYAESAPPHLLEGLYASNEASLLQPQSEFFSSLDLTLYGALMSPLSKVMDIVPVAAAAGAPAAPTGAAVDAVLAAAATDDDFTWDGVTLGAPAGASFGPNRLVLLLTVTTGLLPTDSVNGVTDFNALQLFELGAGGSDWSLPFAVDLATAANPAPGSASDTQQGYRLLRQRFFAETRNADITTAKAYPALHAPAAVARAGTYERWYVADLGTSQPLAGDDAAPEMHPFHIHGVQMVVTRRWQLDGDATSARFVEVLSQPADLDRVARQDTVMVASGQLLEVLVYYPRGISGDFPFHCHLLEHEDMCMMSHVHVTPAQAGEDAGPSMSARCHQRCEKNGRR